MTNQLLFDTNNAATTLGVSVSWLRAKKSACNFIAGEHWIYATGSPGGRLLWNIPAIRQWQVDQTKFHAERQQQLAAEIETYLENTNG
ncbi:MAG: hypothetical protein AB8E87_03510 [Prochlorococcus sp.]